MSAELVWKINAHTTAADRSNAIALGIPSVEIAPSTGFLLARDADGLALHRLAGDPAHPLRLDLTQTAERRAGAGLRQSPLARACGLHRRAALRVLDATAGFARDTVTLAAAGCQVQPLERQPGVFALLLDAYERLTAWPEIAQPAWLSRIGRPIRADAIAWLAGAEPSAFDVIYLDPMFESARRKARPQKALAWLAEIAGADADAARLLEAAQTQESARIVVKQHARATPLGSPAHQIHARAVRFDVYLAKRRD